MAKVTYNNLTTEHETALEVAARLAACCTFYYADKREQYARERRIFAGTVEVWLVFSFDRNEWRVVDPQSWIDDGDDIATYTIDGRNSEAQTQRAILGLIEFGTPLKNINPMPTHPGQFVTENMGRYMVLEIQDRRVRVRSEMSGTELWLDWDNSGYLDVRNAWRLI